MASKKIGAHTEFYKDSRNKWRWRAKANNNKIIADCAEGYNSKKAAQNGAAKTITALVGAWTYSPLKGGK